MTLLVYLAALPIAVVAGFLLLRRWRRRRRRPVRVLDGGSLVRNIARSGR